MTQAKGGRRRVLLRSLQTALVAVAAPAFFARPSRAAALRKVPIYMGTTPHFGNLIVAVEKGFFAKADLPVELTKFASGAVAAEAFRAMDKSIVVSGDLAAVRLWQRGNVGLCSTANYTKLSIVLAKKGIDSPADLKGRKVGVLMGSTSEYFARLYLAKAGMTLNDVDAINLAPAEMVTGIVRGDIDAAIIWQPFGWRTEQATGSAVRVIANAEGYFRERLVASTSKVYSETHQDELRAFVRALADASRWCINNREEAAVITAKHLKLNDVALARNMMNVIDWWPAFTPEFDTDMQRVAAFLKVPLDWNTHFDMRFVKDIPRLPA